MTRYHADPLINAGIERTFDTHPYYAASVLRLRIVADPKVSTFATSTEWVTHYNPTFSAGLTDAERGAVIIHELEHLLLDHAGRCNGREHGQWNVAGDAEINQRLAGLPDGAVYPATLGLPDGLAAEVYYGAAGGQTPDPDKGEGDGSGSGQPGDGSGSGAGTATQDPTDCGSAADGTPRDWEAGDARQPGSGAANGGEDARHEAAQNVLQSAYGGGRGDAPGDALREWAERELDIDRAAWYRALATVVSRSMSQVGAPTTWTWPGRRDIRDMGGAMVPRWTGQRPSAAIVIDTSGSITPMDIEMAVAAAAFIKRIADVRVYGCDTRVTDYGSTVPERIGGGGGTRMDVGIARAVADGNRAVIVITDCDTPWGSDPGVPVIIGANVTGSRYVANGATPTWAVAVPIVRQ